MSGVSANVQLCVEKCEHLSPPKTRTFLKRPFLTDFKKYTHPPPFLHRDMLVHWSKSGKKSKKK